MKNLHDVVEDDLPAEERERLERVHALLVQAGPPPELSPELAHAPEPPTARVIPFPRRYRFTAITAAAVAALALFGLGYFVGGGGGRDPVQTVAMSGASAASATLEVYAKDTAGNWPMELRVSSGLPAGRYELWLTHDGKLAEACGSFAVAADGATVPLNAPYALRDFDGWVVVPAGTTTPVLTT